MSETEAIEILKDSTKYSSDMSSFAVDIVESELSRLRTDLQKMHVESDNFLDQVETLRAENEALKKELNTLRDYNASRNDHS